MKLIAPNGHDIVGTCEHIAAMAHIGEVTGRNADGTYEFDYAGESEIYWDTQTTDRFRGRRIFQDSEGNEWPENKLRLVEI